jgi:predicted Zn-dependent protease
LNQTNDAVAALRYGIRVAPNAEETYMNLARLHLQGGDRAEASTILNQGLEAIPHSDLLRRAIAELGQP